MKRLSILALTLLAASASAQTFQSEHGTLKLLGCGPATTDTGVQCDFQMQNPSGFKGAFDGNEFKFATADGTIYKADRIKLQSTNWTGGNSFWADILPGLPVNVSVIFNDAKAGQPLPYLMVGDSRAQNVPMRGAAVPANVNVGAGKVSVQSSAFTVELSGCTAKNSGYTCTGATLTPKR